MIGIVIVSHSAKLAEGLQELVGQLGGGKVPVAVAGGGPQGELGTSVEKVMTAIQQVASPDGVLVLMDLGSAALSAETAIDLLDPPPPGPVHLSDAPLVEGAVVAVIHAGLGDSLDAVLTAVADARRMPKNLN